MQILLKFTSEKSDLCGPLSIYTGRVMWHSPVSNALHSFTSFYCLIYVPGTKILKLSRLRMQACGLDCCGFLDQFISKIVTNVFLLRSRLTFWKVTFFFQLVTTLKNLVTELQEYNLFGGKYEEVKLKSIWEFLKILDGCVQLCFNATKIKNEVTLQIIHSRHSLHEVSSCYMQLPVPSSSAALRD